MQAVEAVETGRNYAGRTAGERRAERRERLIESAISLYGSSGYRATPVLAVCSRAKVTPRHLYELFANSEELLLAAYDDVISEQNERIAAALAAAPDELEARIRAGLGAAAELWRDDTRAQLIQYEVLGVSERVTRRYSEVMDGFASVIAEQTPARRTVTAQMLAGGLNEALRAWRLADPRGREPLESLIDEATAVFLAALGAEGP